MTEATVRPKLIFLSHSLPPPFYCDRKQIRNHNVHRNKVENPPKPFVLLLKQEDERLGPECRNSRRAASKPMNARHARHVTWLTDACFPHTSNPQTLGHSPPACHNCTTLCLSCTLIPMILPLWQTTTCPLRSQNPLGEGKGCVILQSRRNT